MAINSLQRSAFLRTQEFVDQVNGIVSTEAMYKAESWANMNDTLYQNLSIVAKRPGDYGFVTTILADNNWNVGYDTWAENPSAQKGEIETKVNAWWQFCTGIENEPPPSPQGATVAPQAEPEPEA